MYQIRCYSLLGRLPIFWQNLSCSQIFTVLPILFYHLSPLWAWEMPNAISAYSENDQIVIIQRCLAITPFNPWACSSPMKSLDDETHNQLPWLYGGSREWYNGYNNPIYSSQFQLKAVFLYWLADNFSWGDHQNLCNISHIYFCRVLFSLTPVGSSELCNKALRKWVLELGHLDSNPRRVSFYLWDFDQVTSGLSPFSHM